MKTISALVIVVGLGLAPAGCVFHPDMGERPQCDRDADCAEYGDCACVGGKCVPAYSGAGCGYQSVCEAPELLCDDVCVDVETHPDHCGRCDHPCDSLPVRGCEVNADGDEVAVTYLPAGLCVAGECQYESSDQVCPYGCARGECLEPCQAGDCDPGEVCLDGRCRCGGDGPDCTPAQLCCDSECVDPATDDANCGHCGIDCTDPPPPVCIDGETLKVETAGPCVLGACQFGEELTLCPSGCQADGCVDDPCGGPCVDPPAPWCDGDELVEPVLVGECSNGGCDYPAGRTTHCEFGCDSDAAACLPECTTAADCGPNETCFNGECLCGSNPSCTADQSCCSGACVMSNDDPNHCGGCDRPCRLGLPGVWSAECVGGICNYLCNVGTADCNQDLSDGCETNTDQDLFNCGSCGNSCAEMANADPRCEDGSCVVHQCWGQFSDCDLNSANGCETDLLNDMTRCGSCDNVCDPDKFCLDGTCIPSWADIGVACEQVTCDADAFCCAKEDVMSCLPLYDLSACAVGTALLCDDPSDCPYGAICCYDFENARAACTFDDSCAGGFTLCDNTEDCGMDATCEQTQIGGVITIGVCVGR